MAGGLLQLVAYGEQDLIITGNPSITFFKLVYKKYINFAIKQYSNIFESNINFGTNSNLVKLHKEGDFLNKLIFKTTITSNNSNILGKWNYVNNFGFSLIKKVQLKIGNIIINSIYGDWLCVWKELFNTKQNKLKLDKLIGNTENALSFNGENKNLDIYVPLPFFDNNNLSLPLYNLKTNDIILDFEFRKMNKLINKQFYYFDKNQSINSNPNISNQTYNIELKMSNSYVLADYIIIDKNELKNLSDKNEFIIEINTYQEEILNFNSSTHRKDMRLSNPTKYVSFVIQPGGLLNGKKYLAYSGKNFFEIAAKRFCLRYCATGWVGNNDYLLPYAKYGVFQNDSGESINGIGYNIVFDHGLTSLKSIGSFTNEEKIIYDLFIKLKPTIIKYYGDKIISATIDNISVNIKNLSIQDKYILSLPTEELDNLIIQGGNNNSLHTGDNNNEGNPNYDVNVYDYSNYSNYLNADYSFIDKIGLELNSISRVKLYDSMFFNYLEPYKYNLNTNKNSVFTYSFSLIPNKHTPSGSCNFSGIDSFHVTIKSKSNDKNINTLIYKPNEQIIKNNSKLIIISNNYNILIIKNNIASLKFS